MKSKASTKKCGYCRDGIFENGGCQGECGQDECPHGGPVWGICEFCGGTGLAPRDRSER